MSRDMTRPQFEAALKRYGMEHDTGPLAMAGYVRILPNVSVSRANAGTNRRAQLAYLLSKRDEYEAREAASRAQSTTGAET